MLGDNHTDTILGDRLKALDQLYTLYRSYSKRFAFACEIGCSFCCTQHVTMTTLEAMKIVQHGAEQNKTAFVERLNKACHSQRFKPAFTTNEFAAYCIQGVVPPEEKGSSAQTVCPLLENNQCMIYEVRPFGCRCFFSTIRCTENTSAVVDPLLLTVNSLFLQCIEHLDHGGLFGNMIDTMAFAERSAHHPYTATTGIKNQQVKLPAKERRGSLCRNRPIPALMIPPEHREQVQPIVQELRHILSRIKG